VLIKISLGVVHVTLQCMAVPHCRYVLDYMLLPSLLGMLLQANCGSLLGSYVASSLLRQQQAATASCQVYQGFKVCCTTHGAWQAAWRQLSSTTV